MYFVKVNKLNAMTTKTILKSLVLCSFLLTVSMGCSNKPKKILISNESWKLENQNTLNINSNSELIQFSESELIVMPENEKYAIEWTDDNTFLIDINGKKVNGLINLKTKERLEIAFLYNNETLPINEEDWESLRTDNRVLSIIKESEKKATPKTFIIAGKKIPANQVPPAGYYVSEHDEIIEVVHNDNTITIRTGYNLTSLEFYSIEDYSDTGYFYLSGGNYSSYDYDSENNTIATYLGAMGATEDQNYTEFKKMNISQIQKGRKNKKDAIAALTEKADFYGKIFDYGEKQGNLVLLEFVKKSNQSGQVFIVPEDKMWTPLFFRYEDLGNNYYVGIPRILTEQNMNNRI